MRTKGEAAKAAGMAVKEYEDQSRFFEYEADATAKDLQNLRDEYRHTLEKLALEVLPDAHPQRVQAVAQASGLPSLIGERERRQAQLPGFRNRLSEIAQVPDFANAEALLSPHNGELEAGLEHARLDAKRAKNKGEPFMEEDFQWVIQRENQKAEGVSVLQGFLRAITFAETREGRAKKKLAAKFGVPDWETLFARYAETMDEWDQANRQVSALESRRQALDELIAEYRDLYQWVTEFERRLTAEIQSSLVDHLPNIDPMMLKKVPGPHGPVAAQLHALQAKMKYLGQLEDYLREECADRKKRAMKIDRVRRLWERKPWDRMASDKTKWLVTVPNMKRASTEKRLRWSKRMRRGIVEYDDYDSYDYYYDSYDDTDTAFLAYDVFAYSYEDPFPYEGFSGEVISDIREHREANDLEKADYSLLKGADKAMAAGDVGEYEETGEVVEESSEVDMAEALVAGEVMGMVVGMDDEAVLAAEEAAVEAALEGEGMELADLS